ncbi:hypothetical protein ONZ45_g6026 [Pleurotus djamor]|nr:hypothetical protein ONZ45_g6026 [Pleurotus djamor]
MVAHKVRAISTVILMPQESPPNISHLENHGMSTFTAWPWYNAESTGSASQGLLYALLGVGKFDEISDVDDFTAVKDYVNNQGKADENGRTTVGLAFWVYPTGMHGPYHEASPGQFEEHGLLLTVEPGVTADKVVERVRITRGNLLKHKHVRAAT